MGRSIGHYRRSANDDLKRKLTQTGFQVMHKEHVNMVSGNGWLINGQMLPRTVLPGGQLKTLNTIIRFVEKVEGGLPALFGVSLFSISMEP